MRSRSMAMVLVLGLVWLVAGCSRRPEVAVSLERHPLLDFLRQSPSVRAIERDAADAGLLTGSRDEVQELVVVTVALGITDLEQLERRLERVALHSATLFSAFGRIALGSTNGDLAHWVAVALMALDSESPDTAAVRQNTGWNAAYLEAVLALRDRFIRGTLQRLASGKPDPEATGYRYAVQLTAGASSLVPYRWAIKLDGSRSFVLKLRVRRGTRNLPVFSEPGGHTLVATLQVQTGDELTRDDSREMVRSAGEVRLIQDLEIETRWYQIGPAGTLQERGTRRIAKRAGDTLPLLSWRSDDSGALCLLEQDAVVVLPGELLQQSTPPDADPWFRVVSGRKVGWITPVSRFVTLDYEATPEFRAEMKRSAQRSVTWSGKITVDGADLSHWSAGEGDPLIVLHGGPGLGSFYLRGHLSSLLADRQRLLFYDQRGSGKSSGAEDPGRLSMRQLVEDLEAIRESSQLEQLDLLGHAFGGLLAMHYAIAYPDRVRRLILVAPDPATYALWVRGSERVAARTSPETAIRLAEIEARPGWQIDPIATLDWFDARLPAYFGDPALAARFIIVFEQDTLVNYRISHAAIRADLGEWDLRDDLPLITARTLIITGSESIYPAEAAETLRELIPDSELLVLEGVGHYPFVEARQPFANAVLTFLDDQH